MITFFRIIRTGIVGFWRNIWLSLATVLILIVSLSILTSLIILNVVSDYVVADIRSRVDVSAYFKPDASESSIMEIKADLERFDNVASIEYVSRDEALSRFKEEHADNEVIIQSLDEIGNNPLEASLNIKASEASAYKAIANFIESKYSELVDKVNYRETASLIDRLFSVTETVRRAGLAASGILLFVAFLVAFNTVRLAIFSMRDEISVMRLVGASNFFIRGPFLVEGILGGLLASTATFAIFLGLTFVLSPPVTRFLSGYDIFAYYYGHALQIFMLQLAVGVIVGMASSTIAIRRYLRV